MQCGSGATLSLGCLATGFTPSPLTFTWTKDGSALTDFIQYPSVENNNLYTGVSQIQVRRVDWDNKAKYRCVAKHSNAFSLPTVKVLATTDGQDEASFACFAKDFSPNVYGFKWLLNGHDIPNKMDEIKTHSEARKGPDGTTLYSAASFLTLSPNQWSPDATIKCEFKGRGADKEPSYRPTLFMMTPLEDIQTNTVTLTCFAKDFFPRDVLLRWLVNDQPVGPTYIQSTTNPLENKGSYSVYGQLTISLEEWEKLNLSYSCMLYHESLSSTSNVIVRAITHTSDFLVETNHQWNNGVDAEEDNLGGTALTFILLFLITLLFSIGVTVFKVIPCWSLKKIIKLRQHHTIMPQQICMPLRSAF
uniref:Ig-like domain-containing protein n=1 Tax=Hippocampus comes TaxID=109280 RepID=A0A3Q2XU23_HIPCM